MSLKLRSTVAVVTGKTTASLAKDARFGKPVKVPTKVGVVKDSKEFFPPKQKILDETLRIIPTHLPAEIVKAENYT